MLKLVVNGDRGIFVLISGIIVAFVYLWRDGTFSLVVIASSIFLAVKG